MKIVRVLGWVVGGIFLLGMLVGAGGETSYSAICPRCLQAAHGEERKFWGVTCYSRESLSGADRSIMSPGAMGGSFPAGDARTYEEVMGRGCRHSLVKLGSCSSRWGMIACGAYTEGMKYQFRNLTVAEVYAAYGRLGDAALARASLELLEEMWPVPLPKEERLVELAGVRGLRLRDAVMMPEHPVNVLYEGVQRVETVEEWREVLEVVRGRMAGVAGR